jgi:hypothetical protein
MPARRFPPPWSVEDIGAAFVERFPPPAQNHSRSGIPFLPAFTPVEGKGHNQCACYAGAARGLEDRQQGACSVTAIVNQARRVKSLHTTEEKLDQLAAAIEELARFVDTAQNTIANAVRRTAERGR